MAVSSVTGSSSVPVILRVKRRRCEDPADALVVLHSKNPKYDKEAPNSDLSERSVFHFAGTMPSEEARHDQCVFERVSREMEHRSKVKPNPLAKLSISDKRDDLKAVSKSVASQSRYKLLDKKRALDVNEDTCDDSRVPLTDETSLSATKDHRTNLYISSNKDSTKETPRSNFKDYVKKMAQLYDIVQEEEEQDSRDQGVLKETPSSGLFEDKVTCNGVEMTRERVSRGGSSSVTVATCQERSHDTNDSNYVTDVYYTETCSEMETDSFDWNTLMAIKQPDLVYDIFDSDGDYDDEEDSNDEDNIRNDYPDEEEYSPSEDSGDEDRSDSDEYSDTIRYYRNRRCHYREAVFDDTEDFYNDFDSPSHPTTSNWFYSNAAKLGAVVQNGSDGGYDNDSSNDSMDHQLDNS